MDLFSDAEQHGEFVRARTEYIVPTLEQIKGRDNGLTAVGSFSGCGGSSTGLKMAGWRVPYVIEFVDAAADTYLANYPETFVDRRDIREVQADEILERIGMRRGELDLFEGSPPCASFSSAGAREKGWGKTKKYSDREQRTDDLFFEWARILDGLQPRAFVAENVPGMVAGGALGEYAHKVTALLSELGYAVRGKILNAAAYGVPQERERLIFLGFRRDLGIEPTYPRPTVTEPVTLRQALATVTEDDPADVRDSSMEGKAVGRTWHKLRGNGVSGWVDPASLGRSCETCGGELERDHEVPVTDVLTDGREVERWVSIQEAEEHVRRGGASKGITSSGKVRKARCADGRPAVIVKSYFMLTVPDLDKPCPTLTATGAQQGAASVTHPTECRKFTPREAMAISSFPPDFKLVGTREQRYERMGRAVPPLLYAAVGQHIAELLTWTCSGCGTPDESLRYDGGDACERCVMETFAEAG